MTRNSERFGMFRKLPDGSPIWIGAETDLGRATQTVRDFADKDGLDYFVHDFERGVSIPMAHPKDYTPQT